MTHDDSRDGGRPPRRGVLGGIGVGTVAGPRADSASAPTVGDLATVDTDGRVAEPLATEAVVHTETADRELTAKRADFGHSDRGATITLGIDSRHVSLLDAATGDLLKPRVPSGVRSAVR